MSLLVLGQANVREESLVVVSENLRILEASTATLRLPITDILRYLKKLAPRKVDLLPFFTGQCGVIFDCSRPKITNLEFHDFGDVREFCFREASLWHPNNLSRIDSGDEQLEVAVNFLLLSRCDLFRVVEESVDSFLAVNHGANRDQIIDVFIRHGFACEGSVEEVISEGCLDLDQLLVLKLRQGREGHLVDESDGLLLLLEDF